MIAVGVFRAQGGVSGSSPDSWCFVAGSSESTCKKGHRGLEVWFRVRQTPQPMIRLIGAGGGLLAARRFTLCMHIYYVYRFQGLGFNGELNGKKKHGK